MSRKSYTKHQRDREIKKGRGYLSPVFSDKVFLGYTLLSTHFIIESIDGKNRDNQRNLSETCFTEMKFVTKQASNYSIDWEIKSVVSKP